MNLPLFDVATMALASGRIAYSLTQDEIFRPLRERVYRYSAPMHATNIDGYSWRRIECWRSTAEERERMPFIGKWSCDPYESDLAARKPGWFGMLFECFYCMSAWTSLCIFSAYAIIGTSLIPFLVPFAIWALSNLYAKMLHA